MMCIEIVCMFTFSSMHVLICLYHPIQSPADDTVLQADITTIFVYIESDQHPKLHANKCCYMLVSCKWTNSITPPPLYARDDFSSPLQQVDSIKYLGVVLTSNLTWSVHISNVCTKTWKLIGMFHCSPKVMLRLYKTFIRPHLEYAPCSILHYVLVYCVLWACSVCNCVMWRNYFFLYCT